jgi:hypothetical protein
MNRRSRRGAVAILIAVVLGLSVVIAVSALVVSAKRIAVNRDTAITDSGSSVIAVTGEPIPSEADVFRTKAAVLAIDPTSEIRRGAHPRTLATYRALRAYPGAPPRIPHGLTPSEALMTISSVFHPMWGTLTVFGRVATLPLKNDKPSPGPSSLDSKNNCSPKQIPSNGVP